MVGNNSSGTTSIRYGVTRDKIVEIKAILSDGSAAVFADLSPAIHGKKERNTLESSIYKNILRIKKQNEITKEFPKPEIHRRNTGYAVDILLKSELFDGTEPTINLRKLLCGRRDIGIHN
jgi:FAD/FMN-containing dehydrogenase